VLLVTVEFTTPDWTAITAGGWGGRWDVSVGSMTITVDRKKVLDFSPPYYHTPAQMAASTHSGITTMDGLAGKTICSGESTTYDQWLNGKLDYGTGQDLGKPPAGIKTVTLPTDTDCPDQWKSKRLDYDGWLSSITTVDLGGISRIEEAFALVLAAAAMALYISVGLAERRQELATMAALGASLRVVAGYLWSEAALVVGAALVLAAGLGLLLAEMLVAMLQHVFDPPPDHLALPWPYLGALAAAAVAGTTVAAVAAAIGIRRLPLGRILREE